MQIGRLNFYIIMLLSSFLAWFYKNIETLKTVYRVYIFLKMFFIFWEVFFKESIQLSKNTRELLDFLINTPKLNNHFVSYYLIFVKLKCFSFESQ